MGSTSSKLTANKSFVSKHYTIHEAECGLCTAPFRRDNTNHQIVLMLAWVSCQGFVAPHDFYMRCTECIHDFRVIPSSLFLFFSQVNKIMLFTSRWYFKIHVWQVFIRVLFAVPSLDAGTCQALAGFHRSWDSDLNSVYVIDFN